MNAVYEYIDHKKLNLCILFMIRKFLFEAIFLEYYQFIFHKVYRGYLSSIF